MKENQYCDNLVKYVRRHSREVSIGKVPLGGCNPIRIQSMITVDTMDTMGSVNQVMRMVDAGCEYVRITAPSMREAKNLENIKNELEKRNYNVPLIADIHFTPNAAEIAATIVEKVRVNPGNYADKKKFEILNYTDQQYEDELVRIQEKFTPLIEICKRHGTAIRIGANHGSLSDRILSKYGDTPIGMVESALEFVRICELLDYKDVVISMKSSNPIVMIQAYRLLVNRLDEENLEPYPLHLGVTEAGEAEDGRIKSSLGVGTLLGDGLGDTIRVSLTEPPEVEAPVAKILIERMKVKQKHESILPISKNLINPFEYKKLPTSTFENIGGRSNFPRVIGDFSNIQLIDKKKLKSIGHTYLRELDKWGMSDLGADYLYSGSTPVDFMLPNGLKEIVDYEAWKKLESKKNKYPLFSLSEKETNNFKDISLGFVKIDAHKDSIITCIDFLKRGNLLPILTSSNKNFTADIRRWIIEIRNLSIFSPIILYREYRNINSEKLMLYASTDLGALMIDGLGDGIMIKYITNESYESLKQANTISFGILQAARTRITKTEYISCPSCGRTLFDLQETTAMIREKTDHLKGVKIGIMGCIVNGPGEMADADFGYVGSGKGKITLYKGQEVVKRLISSERALDELIAIIKENGKWVDPPSDKEKQNPSKEG